MRVAVALPTLPREALHRQTIDRTLAALATAGAEVEAFAERPRDRDGDDPFPVFHYLRLPERQAHRPFDTGLALLGRDMRAWEPPYLQMHQFPGAVWVLDPVVHHLAIGGVAAWGRWDEYRDTLEEEFGAEVGTRMTHAVAGGWGVASLYRTRDPLLRRVARQPAACGATPAIAEALQREGAAADIVPLPPPEAGDPVQRASLAPRIFVLRPNYAWPEPTLRGLAEVLERRPEVELAICAPEVVLAAGFRFPRGTEWLRERVQWVGPGDWTRLRAEVDAADLVLHLLDDPTVGERALLERGMARGAALLLLRTPWSDSYEADAAVRVEPGRGQGHALRRALEVLLDEPELRTALGERARAGIAARPDARAVAAKLMPVLERAAAAGFRQHDVARDTWARLVRSVEGKTMPRSAPGPLEATIRGRLGLAAPAPYRAASE